MELATSTLDFVTATHAFAVRSPSGTGFNYTQQDINVHLAERASIPVTFAISSIFPAFAIAAVVLRFVAASRSKAGRTADDWVILVALIPTVASCIWMICTYTIDKDRILKAFFKEAEKGNFTELDDPLGNANALQWGPGVVSTLYLTALALIKISILLLYRRLFPTKVMERIVLVGIVLVSCIWITFVVPSLMGLASAGDLSNGTIIIFVLIFACINLVADLALLVLPVPFVWKLKLSSGRKMQIVGMFSLGAFCVISSTVRLAYLVEYWRMLNFIFAHELNWYASFTLAEFAKRWWMIWIWALIEPCTSIIAACLPTLRPLVDGASGSHPQLAKIFGALYPRSLFSRSTKHESSEQRTDLTDSTEMSKVQAASSKDVGATKERIETSMQKAYAWPGQDSRQDWNNSKMNLGRAPPMNDANRGKKVEAKEWV